MTSPKDNYKGFYSINKPSGPTSHDVIDKLRDLTEIQKIGHAGTLDPMAKGVLVVAIGREYTKQISKYKNSEKEYEATIQLGKKSDTNDRKGEVKKTEVNNIPDQEMLKKVLNNFKGNIKQIPPIYSAVKVNGVPSYKLAREGKEPDLAPRKVKIKQLDLLSYNYPTIKLHTITGPGVYLRALARDIGKKLSVGGILTQLTRIRVGKFQQEDCYSLNEFKAEII